MKDSEPTIRCSAAWPGRLLRNAAQVAGGLDVGERRPSTRRRVGSPRCGRVMRPRPPALGGMGMSYHWRGRLAELLGKGGGAKGPRTK